MGATLFFWSSGARDRVIAVAYLQDTVKKKAVQVYDAAEATESQQRSQATESQLATQFKSSTLAPNDPNYELERESDTRQFLHANS